MKLDFQRKPNFKIYYNSLHLKITHINVDKILSSTEIGNKALGHSSHILYMYEYMSEIYKTIFYKKLNSMNIESINKVV